MRDTRHRQSGRSPFAWSSLAVLVLPLVAWTLAATSDSSTGNSLSSDPTGPAPSDTVGGAAGPVLTPNADPRAGCTTVNVFPATSAEPGAMLTVTIIDDSPYGPGGLNDCNDDGDRTDTGTCTLGGVCSTNADCSGPGDWCLGADDDDCNDNGIQDLEGRMLSEGEPNGERIFLDLVSPATYQSRISVSTKFNMPGVLFVRFNGTSNAIARAQYDDRDDGLGGACGPREGTATFTPPRGQIILQSYDLADNGDGDVYADTNETVTMTITAVNKVGMALTGVTARLFTQSPNIACISDNVVSIGAMAAGETVTAGDTFTFRVAGVDRPSLTDDFSAAFQVTFQANEIDLASVPQEIVLDLDLDVAGAETATTFSEGFEAAGFGQFTSMTLDTGKATNALSNGFRCQYTDPDAPRSNTFGDPTCFLGFVIAADNAFDWHNHNTTAADGGRAYSGTRSLHLGVHQVTGAKDDTTRLSQLDAIRMTNPVNLRRTGIPELSFKQQISLVDNRVFAGIPVGETLDRGKVQVQLADAAGTGFGPWQTIRPYYNLYDAQGTVADVDRCMFDPTDDGNNEDSFFSPRDLLRILGPSSGCYTEQVFGFQGDTSTLPFAPGNIGRASDGPGLQGSINRGTWVETKFNLERYRGRRIRIRFLATTAEDDPTVLYNPGTLPSGSVEDDGWFIDNVTITNLSTTPDTVAADGKNLVLPACPATCTTLTAALTSNPPALSAPGLITLSAAASTSDACVNGILQYQFWKDVNRDGVVGPSPDVLLRDWTDLPTIVTNLVRTTQYGVRVRCATEPVICLDDAVVLVTKATPGEVTRVIVAKAGATDYSITYTPACGAQDNTIVYGPLSGVATYSYSGQICNMGNTGAFGPFSLPAGSIFFFVVGNDNFDEGPYGGAAPPYMNPPVCSYTQDLSTMCP